MGKAICVRCKRPFGPKTGLQPAKICQNCLDALSYRELSPFLESLSLPAAFVRKDCTIIAFNTSLGRIMGRFAHDVAGVRIGDAIECAYCERHEVCGERAICRHCGIKRMLDLARISGEEFSGVQIAVRRKSGQEHKHRFTFAKAGEKILVIAKL
jgi:hypothetical protein